MNLEKLTAEELELLFSSIANDDYINVVKICYNKKIPIGYPDEGYEYSIFPFACKQGNMDIIRFLYNNSRELISADTIVSPLHAAIIGNHIDVVDFLIQQDTDINKCSKNFYVSHCHILHTTPLALAIFLNHFDIAKLLIEHGACIGSVICHSEHFVAKIGCALTMLFRKDKKELFNLALNRASFFELFAIHKTHYNFISLLDSAILNKKPWAAELCFKKFEELNMIMFPASSSEVIIKAHKLGLKSIVKNYLTSADITSIEANGETMFHNIEKECPDLVLMPYLYACAS